MFRMAKRSLPVMDLSGTLDYYFKPPLSLTELRKARLEGWILGFCCGIGA